MTTTTPTTQLVTTLDTLPRPKISLTAWAKLWLAPETARQHFAALGERFTLDVPLLPTMFWTSSPDDVRAVFQEKTRALSLGAGLRRLAPHEIVFGSRIMEWWASDDHTVVRRKIAPAFMARRCRATNQPWRTSPAVWYVIFLRGSPSPSTRTCGHWRARSSCRSSSGSPNPNGAHDWATT